MFLLEPGQTPYDLRWRMFGIDVRVHPMFWLITAILGFSALDMGFEYLLLWIGCVFFSILIHELGHVFMFQAFGARAHVVLYAFGGLAIPYRGLYNRWQRIAVSFAGPLAGFLVIGTIAVVLAVTGMQGLESFCKNILFILGVGIAFIPFVELHSMVGVAIYMLLQINLLWGLLNLLPVYPLDGGHISRDFLDGVMPGGQGVRMSLGISLLVAGVLAVHCLANSFGNPLIPFLAFGSRYTAVMFGLLAFESYQLLQQERNPPWYRED